MAFNTFRGLPSQFPVQAMAPQPFGPAQAMPAFGPPMQPGLGNPSMLQFGNSFPGAMPPMGGAMPPMAGAMFPGSWNPYGGGFLGYGDGGGEYEPDFLADPNYCRVSQITDSVYLTNKTGGALAGLMERLRITLVIAASKSHEIDPPNDQYCDFKRISVPNDPSSELIKYFDEVSDLIESEEEKGGRVLVQSLEGRSRGPTLVIAYLMKSKGIPLNQAYNMVLEKRPITRPFTTFWKQLIMYERELFGENSCTI